MARFFISYTRTDETDRELALRLRAGLGTRNHDVFMDVTLSPGTSLGSQIDVELNRCEVFVVLVSTASAERDWVLSESRKVRARHAQSNEPRIVHIGVRTCPPFPGELDALVGRFLGLPWTKPEDEPNILDQLHKVGVDVGGAVATRPSKPSVTYVAPTGMVGRTDARYVKRNADELAGNLVTKREITTVFLGPKGYGKSTLMRRYFEMWRRGEKEEAAKDEADHAYIDLYEVSRPKDFKAVDCYKAIQDELATQMGMSPSGATANKNDNLIDFIQKRLLPSVVRPLVIGFDHLDALNSKEYGDAVLTKFRRLHNRCAMSPPDSPWRRLFLVFACATDAGLQRETPFHSAFFNVAPCLVLGTFSEEHCKRLNEAYHLPLTNAQLSECFELLGGHPYLTQVAYADVRQGRSYAELERIAVTARGPFWKYLEELKERLNRSPALRLAMNQVILEGNAPSGLAQRLVDAGLIKTTDDEKRPYAPACRLYKEYFLKNP